MKNFILAITCLLMINVIFGQATSLRKGNTPLPESTQIASEYFSKIYGNSGNNTFVKAIVLQNNYYIIGKNSEKATITKIDIMGNLVWTKETSSDATWRDIVANKDGNLLLVGHLGVLNTQAKSLIGVVNISTGNFVSLKSYDIKVGGRESLKSIYQNSIPLNSSYPYYIIGFITNSGNEDDVLLVNIDDNGTINFIKKYANADDEFYQGITVGGQSGDMMLYGGLFDGSSYGVTVNISNSGNVESGRFFNSSLYFFSHLTISNPMGYSHILGGRNISNNRAKIIKINGNAVVYNYDIDQVNNISYIYAVPGTQSFIAIGTGNFGGVNKSVLMHFTESGNSLTLNWTKLYETTETAISEGFGRFVSNNKFLYLDSRTNHRNNLGNSDGFLTISQANFENCIDNNITLNITPMVDTLTEFAPTVTDEMIPTATNESSNNISYNDADICQLPCSVSFSYTAGECGVLDFSLQTNLTGDLTYNWTFGTNPQTNNTQQNPSHSYLSNGTYNVCVTVTSGATSCNVCQNVIVNNADVVAPNINCPNNIQISNNTGQCYANITPQISVTDNCDPNPTCNCIMTGATSGVMPKNANVQFNVGATTVTCTATDVSGNVSQPCSFTVTVFDSQQPSIVCPPNITISCNQNEDDFMITGQAVATDNCPGVMFNHSDSFSGNICSGIITRTWTATDASGAIASCVQLIKKEDKVAPQLQCPANVTINCDQQPQPAITGTAVASDNCQSGINPTYTDNTIGTGCNKYIERIWSANDGCGNISTCVQNIYFLDQIAPEAVCPPNLTINCLPTDWMTANFGSASGTDNCGSVTISNFDRTFSGTNCNGVIESWWRATDECGIQNECLQRITVLDTIAPNLTHCGNKYIVQGVKNPDGLCFGNATINTPSDTDTCSGNVIITNSYNNTTNASGGYPVGQTIITWTAKDDCGLMTMCQDTVVVLECANCCWDSLAFAAVAAMDFNIIRDECSVHISHPGLSPCQRVTYTWATGVSTGYLSGTANATFDYGISGDYTLCTLIEEVDDSGMVCFSSQKCYDVCVTCGDGCTDDRIVYECGNIVGESNWGSERLVKSDLDYYGSLVYAASSEMNGGYSEACIRVVDLNCTEVNKVLFSGNLDDYAGSVKYDKINNRLVVGGIFDSDTLYIADMNGGFIKLVNSGFNDGFVASLDPTTLKAYWAFKIGDNWPDEVNDIAINSLGYILVGGKARNNMDFDPLNLFSYSFIQRSVSVGFVAKYDHNGSLIWYNLIEPDKDCNVSVRALDVDEFDNIYAGGIFTGIYWDGISPKTPAPHKAEIIDPPTGIIIDPYLNYPLLTSVFSDWTNFILQYNDAGTYSQSREIFHGINFGGEGHEVYDLEYDNNNVYVVGSNMIGSYPSNNLQTTNWQYKTGLWDSNIKVQDGMLYTIGNLYNSYDQDHTSAGSVVNPSYSGIDFAVGIYALDGSHKKSMLIGGSANERVAGLVTIPNSKDFFVQGLSRSVYFHPNPEMPSNIINSTPTLGDRSIFIGKYSCACAPDTDCCENLSASFSGQDTCCKSLDLVNNAGFDICKVTVELTSPGWTLNTSSTASGYIFNSIYNGIEISHTSGSLPTETLNNLVEFCLSGSGTTLSSTQQFIVNWYENTTSGNKLVSCTDTLTMACDPPPPPDSCVVINLINVACDPLNPNVYNVTFTVTNHSNNINATTAFLSGLPSGFTFIPCPSGTYASDIAIPIFPSLAPGMTSAPLCFQIYSVNPILDPTDVCFEINLKGLDGNYFTCCEESEEQCITLTPCCLPCENLEVSITSTSLGSEESCCYGLSLINQCSYQYFTKMDVNILTSNIHFGFISPDANWSICTPPTLQNICLEPNSGTIGSGNFNDVLQFCLTNVTSLSQIPQKINVKFYTSDINGLDSLACDTLIYLECPFKPTTNDSCVIVTNSIAYCDPETNKYNVSMTIMNNSNPSFCAQELVINLLEPGVANPSAIQLSDPLCYGESVTVNFMLNTTPFPDIDGLMPLIISLKNLDGTCCRGGLAYIDTLVLPECPCTITCCDSGQNEDFENYALGNLPNNQVGWVNHQANPQIVTGGANGSVNCIALHSMTRFGPPASVSYGNSGVVGPDTIFQANKQYCITFWAKLLPTSNFNGRLGIYADGHFIQNIFIPFSNTGWTQYSFNFIAPLPGQEILIFTNESPAPLDFGPSILIDQICFDEVVPIFDDMTPPVLSCPMDLTIQDSDSDCSITYTIPNITVTDPSGVAFVQCYLDGVLVPIGSTHNLTNSLIHTIQFIAEDVCGNRDSCSYLVSISCEPIFSVNFQKNFVSISAGNNGVYEVKYSISISNNSGVSGIYSLKDIPLFDDDVTILSGNYSLQANGSMNTSGFTALAINAAINSGSTHIYNVTFFVSLDLSATSSGDNIYSACGGGSGNLPFEGLYNLAELDLNGDGISDSASHACGDLPCICTTNILPFTITHNSIRTDVKCGETIDIKCPVTSIFVTGMLNCQSTSPVANCPPNAVTWNLDRPNLPNLSGTIATGNISVMLLATDVTEPGLYSITFSTLCPGSVDECECVISWIQEDCNSFCPNNIAQNGDFGVGAATSTTTDIGNAIAWNSQLPNFNYQSDLRNTSYNTSPILQGLPLIQGNFGSLWIDNSTDANKRQVLVNSLGATLLPSNQCYDLNLLLSCLIPTAETGTPIIQIFGIRTGAIPISPSINQTSPPNIGLYTLPLVSLGTIIVHLDQCDNNFMSFSVQFNGSIIPTGGIDRIMITRRDQQNNQPYFSAYMGVDDVCLGTVNCAQNCACNGLEGLSFFSVNNPNVPISCNNQTPVVFGCDERFGIHGDINCSDDGCEKSVGYTIYENGNVHSGGSASVNGNHFDLFWINPNTLGSGDYQLEIEGFCGSGPCLCFFNFKVVCDTCCRNPQKFLAVTNNAAIVTMNQCEATVSTPNLGDCIKIKSINWGNGNTLNGPLPTGQSYANTYINGNYTIVITFAEYDADGKECFTNVLSYPVIANCQQVCVCKSKSVIHNRIPIDCNDRKQIKCGSINVFSAVFACNPSGCSTSNVGYQILDANLNVVTQGYTSTVTLLPGWFDANGGTYYLEFTGFCGTDRCTCRVTLEIEKCPQTCLCGIDFITQVDLGFKPIHLGNCLYEFTPKNLCKGDIVTWKYNGTVIYNTFGNTSIFYTVPNVSPNTICMEVTRYDVNGVKCVHSVCRILKRCNISIPKPCNGNDPLNPQFNQFIAGDLSESASVLNWSLLRGEAYVEAEDDTSSYVTLVSRGEFTDLYQKCCLGESGQEKNLNRLTLNLKNEGLVKFPEGSKLQIFCPSDVTVTDLDGLKTEIDLNTIGFNWQEVVLSNFSDPAWKFDNLILRLKNPTNIDVSLSLDDPCLDFIIGTNDIYNNHNFTIHPNPTTGQLTIQFSTTIENEVNMKVLDVLGREVKNDIIQKGRSSFNFSINDMAGIYIIHLTDSSGNSSQRKVIKIE
ncbi:MAG: T9SS type A sorting domain-containing protein [Saprospiraceae bacterium]|nr:T9SS type A sorting domain-containing protein [Saprospiraceae bacterium]MBP6565985.1 T9SS type A sorting domain-containing protein [Saprospiraceae bacterium]